MDHPLMVKKSVTLLVKKSVTWLVVYKAKGKMSDFLLILL